MKPYKKILIIAILIFTIIGCFLKFTENNKPQTIKLTSENEIVLWLISNNIDITDSNYIECNNIIIPENTNKIFKDYKSLQNRQSIPIENFLGKEAKEYIFLLENNFFASVIICDDYLAGAMIYDAENPDLMFPII
jgi:hypothetical protein